MHVAVILMPLPPPPRIFDGCRDTSAGIHARANCTGDFVRARCRSLGRTSMSNDMEGMRMSDEEDAGESAGYRESASRVVLPPIGPGATKRM
jgi:hypothetical protein